MSVVSEPMLIEGKRNSFLWENTKVVSAPPNPLNQFYCEPSVCTEMGTRDRKVVPAFEELKPAGETAIQTAPRRWVDSYQVKEKWNWSF